MNGNVDKARFGLDRSHGTGSRARWVLYGLLGWLTTGCVGTIYAVKANSAAANLEQARTLGAERTAEYEYWRAKAYLEKAMEEAAEAEYGDAIEFASIADESAEKAVELARAAHRSAGR